MSEAPVNNHNDVSAMTKLLVEASCGIGIELGEKEVRLFQEYYRELLFWNRRMNLVSLKSAEDIPVKHFVDSLTAARYIANKEGSLLDIGAGAGFPGIPLKIACSSLNVTLLEASRRKASFLKNVLRRLELRDIRVINRRAELLLEEKGRGFFDAVISRATFKLPEYLRIGAEFLSPRGVLIAMKGPGIDAELEASGKALTEAGLKLSCYSRTHLPISGDVRKILIFQKA